jgi:hypothetical protein
LVSDILSIDQEMLNYYSDSLSAVADEAAYTSRLSHF